MQLDVDAARPAAVIREAKPDEVQTGAAFWGLMYEELALGPRLESGWHDRAVAYFDRRREAGELAFFVADAGGKIVASAGACLQDGFSREFGSRARGYIFGVYVVPAWRRNGLAVGLTRASIDWLRARGVPQIRLHAADNARPIYERLGFVAGNEMVLRV